MWRVAAFNMIMKQEAYMQRCLELAKRGAGQVAPNPMVGAVLVCEDRIIGEGWHRRFGEAHAEVNCLNAVAEKDRPLIPRSRMFVSLEPCAHFGHTPPCADRIISEKIPAVVIGCSDSYREVAGRGIQKLMAAGIKVETGILEKECRKMNRRFFTRQEKNRPYIILKWAESNDGYMAPSNGVRTQLSGPVAQKLVHKMRSEEDAILVGYQTAVHDDPMLNDRYWGGNQPIRIVLDFENTLPANLHIFRGEQQTLVFNFHKSGNLGNNRWIKINRKASIPQQVLEQLSNINSLIIEGGSKTLNLFIEESLWDEALVFKTPVTLVNGVAAPRLKDSKQVEQFLLGKDVLSLHAHERNGFYL
jgi:diaminohydroxyphosphoribosylaminopyrimidine deaminase/5-amino-6-(5-phosphoribosylamino)uracil reductase